MGVEIKTSAGHSTVPSGTRDIILKYLRLANMSMELRWTAFQDKQVKGRPHRPEFKVKKVTNRRAVQVCIMPGGNDTAFYYNIIPPDGMTPEHLFNELREAEAKQRQKPAPKSPPPPQAPPSSEDEDEQNEREESSLGDAPPPPTEERREELLRGFSGGESLAGFTAKIENTQLALIALSGRGDEDGWLSMDQARSALREELELNSASSKSLGSIIGALERHGYLEGDRTSGHLKWVRISLAGERLIRGEMEPATSPQGEETSPADLLEEIPPEVPEAVDPIVVVARQVEDELGQCEARREKLVQEMIQLDNRIGRLEQALEALKPLLE